MKEEYNECDEGWIECDICENLGEVNAEWCEREECHWHEKDNCGYLKCEC